MEIRSPKSPKLKDRGKLSKTNTYMKRKKKKKAQAARNS